MSKTKSLPGPLYHQIFVDLVDGIRSGKYSEGSFLPSELELSKSYDVSRITAKRALDEIAAAGLAVREQGRGTVIRNARRQRSVLGSLTGPIDDLRKAERAYIIKVIGLDRVRASKQVARMLHVAPGSFVLQARRLLSGEAGPASFLTTYVPYKLSADWSSRMLTAKSITTLLEDSGIMIARSQEHISAVPAGNEAAELLQVAPGDPLLRVVRTVYDDKGHCVEYVTAVHRSDRYDYSVNLGGPAN